MRTPYLLVTFLLCSTGLSQAEENTLGEELYTPCAICHGGSGRDSTMPEYPKIGGQHPEYIIDAMKAYRDGQRQGTYAELMKPVVAELSDEQIKAVAEYVSQLQGF